MQNSNQGSLFGESEIAMPEIPLVETVPATKKERLSWEKELLGLYISDHPTKEYKEYFRQMATPLKDINAQTVGRNINVGGVITKIQKIFLKNQQTMLFVMIEDTDNKIEILVFPKTLETTGSVWEEDRVVLVSGKISDKDGNFKLLCDNAKVIDQEEFEKFKRIIATRKANDHYENKKGAVVKKQINVSLGANASQEILRKLSQVFNNCDSGETKVYLTINNSKLETPYRIRFSENLEPELKKISAEIVMQAF